MMCFELLLKYFEVGLVYASNDRDDDILCGLYSFPCKNMNYGINRLLVSPITLIIVGIMNLSEAVDLRSECRICVYEGRKEEDVNGRIVCDGNGSVVVRSDVRFVDIPF
jgi:hypothetical protein